KLIIPALWYAEPVRRRLLIGLNIDAIVGHVSRHIRQTNTTSLEPLFDEQLPIGSTAYMRPWLTTKPCEPTRRSQISHAVHDSTWEKAVVEVCEKSDDVVAWAKNDHLDFVVRYLWLGSSRRFIPDFLIKLANNRTLVLEVKGQDSDRNRAKRAAMVEWVQTINATGGFGQWCFDTVFDPAQTRDVIALYSSDRIEQATA
nr:type III restriction endonuclease subunit R [Salinisphaera sp.]